MTTTNSIAVSEIIEEDWLYPDGHIWALDGAVFCPTLLGTWLEDVLSNNDSGKSLTCPVCGVEMLYATLPEVE